MPVAAPRRAGWFCTVQIGAALLALLPLAAPAQAQVPPERDRTVDWYVTHPAQREAVRRACLNDPGHLAAMPDCINAKRADLQAAINSSASGVPSGSGVPGYVPPARDPRALGLTRPAGPGVDTSDPDTPEYWTRRPGDRGLKLAYCSRSVPQGYARTECEAARQSLMMEQSRGSASR